MKIVLHCSYLHPVDDSRIMRYIAQFKSNQKIIGVKSTKNNYIFKEVNPKYNKFLRLLISVSEIIKFNLKNNKNNSKTINIFHDPFLLIFSPLIKLTGGTIVFDAHEDIPINLKMRGKSNFYIFLIKIILYMYIKFFCKFSIVCVESQRLRWYFPNNSIFPNYANIDHIKLEHYKNNIRNLNKVIYIGNLSKERGAFNILKLAEAVENSNLIITICGKTDDLEIENKFCTAKNIKYLGWLDVIQFNHELNTSSIGISLLENNEAYYLSYPLKIIDYIRFGIPFLSTPNKFVEKIVEKYGLGIIARNDDEIRDGLISIARNIDHYNLNYLKYKDQIIEDFKIIIDNNLIFLND